MPARVNMEFAGQSRSLALADDSCETWQRLRSSAAELSGLESFEMKYEDEEGYLQTLSEETLGDLLWVAEGAVPAARLVVRSPQNNVESLDLAWGILRSRLNANPSQASVEEHEEEPQAEDHSKPGWPHHLSSALAEDKGSKSQPKAVCCRRRREADAVLLSDLVRHVVSQMF